MPTQQSDGTHTDRGGVWPWLSIGLLISAAVFLRFHDLGGKPFWIDEASDWFCVTHGSLLEQAPIQFFILLYLFLQKAIVAVVASEVGLRILSAVSSCVGVLALILIVRKVSTRRAALLAGSLMTFSVLDIYYAQEGRPYALGSALVLLFTLALFSTLEKPTRKKRVFLVLTATAALTSSFQSLFLVSVALACAVVWKFQGATAGSWKRRLSQNLHRLGGGKVCLPVLGVALAAILSAGYFGFTVGSVKIGREPVGMLPQVLELTRFFAGDAKLFWGIFVAGCLAGIVTLLPKKQSPWGLALMIPAVAVFGSLLIFAFHGLTYKIEVRYFLPLLPFWAATWAMGLDLLIEKVLPSRWSRGFAALGFIVLAAATALPHLQAYYKSPIKWIWSSDARGAFEQVCLEKQPDEIVFSVSFAGLLTRYYFSGPCDPDGENEPVHQVYFFHEPIARRIVLDYGRLLNGQSRTPDALAVSGFGPSFSGTIDLPWPARRVWLAAFPIVRSPYVDDLSPWWQTNPNDLDDADIELPNGAFLRQRGPMLLVRIPNPSPDPTKLDPKRMMEDAQTLFSIRQKQQSGSPL